MPSKDTYHDRAVRSLILLRETGPKSAAWHRARVQLIWRLHRQIAQTAQSGESPVADPIPTPPGRRAESE
jgi:hypothetical protein